MTIWITSNGRPSNGAKALSLQPGFRRCVTGNRIKPGDTVVNWGSSSPLNLPHKPNKPNIKFLNPSPSVQRAANKLNTFKCMLEDGVDTVQWTASMETAQLWKLNGACVVARQKLQGHSGDGIVIIGPGEPMVEAPLYTKYVFKDKEFRVHVVDDEVVDTQWKIKDPDREVISWKVRSHQNGFMYVRKNIYGSMERDNLAIAAVKALGLDFGAVDIIQDKEGLYYVLEVNTAPGLEGQTVELYAKAFRNYDQAA